MAHFKVHGQTGHVVRLQCHQTQLEVRISVGGMVSVLVSGRYTDRNTASNADTGTAVARAVCRHFLLDKTSKGE